MAPVVVVVTDSSRRRRKIRKASRLRPGVLGANPRLADKDLVPLLEIVKEHLSHLPKQGKGSFSHSQWASEKDLKTRFFRDKIFFLRF